MNKNTQIHLNNITWKARIFVQRTVGVSKLLAVLAVGLLTNHSVAEDVSANKPVWRVDKPFGERLAPRHFRHNYVGGMEFSFPSGWSVQQVSPNAALAVRPNDKTRELTHDSTLSHDQVSGGAFLFASMKKGKSKISVTVFLERIPNDTSDADFVLLDQKRRYSQTVKDALSPKVEQAIARTRALIGGRSCEVVDVDGIYGRGGLKERFYYLPAVPSECASAKRISAPRYMYVMRFRVGTYADREGLTLTVPGIVKMAGPMPCNGYITREENDAQNLIFTAINRSNNTFNGWQLQELLDSSPAIEELFTNAVNATNETARNGSWNSFRNLVAQHEKLKNDFHDQQILTAWEELAPSQQLLVEKSRPDFVSAVDSARARMARKAFGG